MSPGAHEPSFAGPDVTHTLKMYVIVCVCVRVCVQNPESF